MTGALAACSGPRRHRLGQPPDAPTKSFTLPVAAEALDEGVVDLDDIVTQAGEISPSGRPSATLRSQFLVASRGGSGGRRLTSFRLTRTKGEPTQRDSGSWRSAAR